MIYSCNSAYRLRYWNHCNELQQRLWTRRCNSAYRLRYWNLTHLLHLANLLHVATVLTACGIETFAEPVMAMITLAVATVLTACGIETMVNLLAKWWLATVATVLTACGIETLDNCINNFVCCISCNSAYRLRYWNEIIMSMIKTMIEGCNSAYRLRYWNNNLQHFELIFFWIYKVATVLTACGIETYRCWLA